MATITVPALGWVTINLTGMTTAAGDLDTVSDRIGRAAAVLPAVVVSTATTPSGAPLRAAACRLFLTVEAAAVDMSAVDMVAVGMAAGEGAGASVLPPKFGV
jgi:hypothetical protein